MTRTSCLRTAKCIFLIFIWEERRFFSISSVILLNFSRCWESSKERQLNSAWEIDRNYSAVTSLDSSHGRSFTFIREVQYPTTILPLLGAMRSNAKMNQKRKHEEHIKYMHYPTFSNRTYGLTSVWTDTLSFWNTY